MNKIYYFANYTANPQDGGTSRDNAFFDFISKVPNVKVINVFTANILKRILMWFRCSIWFLTVKRTTLLIHQNSLLSIYSGTLLNNKIYRWFIFKVLMRAAWNNRLIIEVNDLRYEQAIDLQLPFDSGFLALQNALLSLPNAEFIFASYQMRTYVIDNLGFNLSHAYVIVNGGISIKKSPAILLPDFFMKSYDRHKINYVYAGSLIPGRQISELLGIFAKQANSTLYLLGVDGAWLLQRKLPYNIHYLGSLAEDVAYSVVEKCDIGLIPYDDSKFYYNLCYPTKASFYLTAGIPFLSTRLDEMIYNFSDLDVAMFYHITDWVRVISTVRKEDLYTYKERVQLVKENYLWLNLLRPLNKILMS